MKKWILYIGLLVLIVLSWQSWSLYQDAVGYKQDQLQDVTQDIQSSPNVAAVERVTLYYGQKSYGVARAKLKSGEQVIIYMSLSEKEKDMKPLIVPKQGYNQEDILKVFKAERTNVKKIVEVKLGIFNQVPAWEITYVNQNDQYVFEYYRYDTKEYLNRIKIS